jgi:hypothetical protein
MGCEHTLQVRIGGSPGHDVIFDGRKDIGRLVDPSQIDRRAAHGQPVRRSEIVLRVHIPDIPAIHRPRQIGDVGVPE